MADGKTNHTDLSVPDRSTKLFLDHHHNDDDDDDDGDGDDDDDDGDHDDDDDDDGDGDDDDDDDKSLVTLGPQSQPPGPPGPLEVKASTWYRLALNFPVLSKMDLPKP